MAGARWGRLNFTRWIKQKPAQLKAALVEKKQTDFTEDLRRVSMHRRHIDLRAVKIEISHLNVNRPQSDENIGKGSAQFRRNGCRLAGDRIKKFSGSDQIHFGGAVRQGQRKHQPAAMAFKHRTAPSTVRLNKVPRTPAMPLEFSRCIGTRR